MEDEDGGLRMKLREREQGKKMDRKKEWNSERKKTVGRN